MECYDVIIVGAGPIGMTLAIEASKAKLSHLIIEKGVLVNSLYNFPSKMTFFSTSKLLETGEVPFISHSEKPNREEALEYYRRVKEKWQLNINYYEKLVNLIDQQDKIRLISSKQEYLAKSVVLATGFYDNHNPLDIPGAKLKKVKHYYKDAHPYIGQKVLVVGAANSACDVALELYHKGAEVSMLVRKPELSPRVKYWIRPNIENRIKEGKIKAYFSSELISIQEDSVNLATPEGALEVENNFVLAMTGYRPDYNLLGHLNLNHEDEPYKTPVYNPVTHESSRQNIYLAGVLCGGLKTNTFFIENAMDHAQKIINDLVSKIN